jgi:long-chain acyl-CoA synthetase
VNLADLVRDAAEDHPAKDAIVFQGRAMTFADLDDRVDLTAAALASLGVERGDRVALLAGNVPEFVDALYGTVRAGAVACPLNVMLTPEELGYVLADAGAKALVTELSYLENALAARDRAPELRTIVVIGGPPAPAGTVSLEEALTHAGPPPQVDTQAGDVAVVAYTAGTTANPKGAMLTHGNLLANLDQMMSVPALAEATEDVVLVALPMFHIYALNVVLGLCLRTGASAVLVERFDAAEAAALVRRHGVTVLFGAPPMFRAWVDLLEDGTLSGEEFASVRLAASGAAALPPEVLEGFLRHTGVTIWEGYGLTETAPAVATTALGQVAKPGSIGLPLPGLDLRLLDEHGEEVEDGDAGEIVVRGPNVFAGYWNRDDETSQVLTDGWLHTGDIAYRDEDGYLFLVDRKKDLIIVSGFNVFPKEVEEAIAAHPAVAEVAVIGVPDRRTGEAVEAWVAPVEGAALRPEDVVAFVEQRLARFKVPKIVKIVDELPHHVTGKVLRRALREEAEPDEQPLDAVAGEPSGSEDAQA